MHDSLLYKISFNHLLFSPFSKGELEGLVKNEITQFDPFVFLIRRLYENSFSPPGKVIAAGRFQVLIF
jgi:hypothetical protein